MSRIIRAANAMLSNSSKIGDLVRDGKEYYFSYDQKYKWSMKYSVDSDEYLLFFYSGDLSINELREVGDDWSEIDFIKYSTDDFVGAEGVDTFMELYTMLKEKLFGIDKALDDIISQGDDGEIIF